MKLTLWQRFQLWLDGCVYLEHRTEPGWKTAHPFYVFKCPTHGLVENRPHGYEDLLKCPKCLYTAKPSKTDV